MESQSKNDPLARLSDAILSGDKVSAINATNEALQRYSIDDILNKGVLAAWATFVSLYEKDPVGTLKTWDAAYFTTRRVLNLIESSISVRDPLFSVIVATVRGEGHTLMRDIIATYLRSKNIGVHCPKIGITIDDIKEELSKKSLKFLVLSCIDPDTEETLKSTVALVRQLRPDVKIIAGGPIAGKIGADAVASKMSEVYAILKH
ncbi:MAG: cobalamin-dependent protein [Candidatus Methanomethyliaceae archaeon]|nr:cobalamin-dependent protein [Candidatus Methanomethyliaceae archaeon]